MAAGALLEEAPRLAADALKAMAVAVHERLEEIPGLQMVGLVHDEVLLLAPEEHAKRTKDWLTGIMEGVGGLAVNGGRPPEERVPIVADTHWTTGCAGFNHTLHTVRLAPVYKSVALIWPQLCTVGRLTRPVACWYTSYGRGAHRGW